MSEPSSIYAGDTITWTKSLSAYPAPTWTLKYSLVRDGGAYDITAAADGSDFLVTVPASTSADWLPADYTWTAYVTDSTQRFTVETGTIKVLANPASGGYDARTTAKVMLDNIEAYLIDPNNLAAASYSIGGRSLSRWSRGELLTERDRLMNEVRSQQAAQRIARGLGNPRRLYVRFDRA